MSSTADPITTEVIRNFVVSCAEDMNAALYRSAFSSVIYEGRDSAVALLDKNGDMLGQSTGVPIFIGNIDVCVKCAIDRYGDDFAEGDVVAMNDPYLQGTHTHDMTVIGPIYHGAARRLRRHPRPLAGHRRHRPRHDHGLDLDLPRGAPSRPDADRARTTSRSRSGSIFSALMIASRT